MFKLSKITAPNVIRLNWFVVLTIPAIFLIDVGGDCLWLWQGWWPEAGHDAGDTNLATGSGLIRWHAERRVAMETTVEYRDEKYRGKRPPMKLVWAGHEPLEFTNLFPSWNRKEDIHQLNQKVCFSKLYWKRRESLGNYFKQFSKNVRDRSRPLLSLFSSFQ